MKTSKKNSQLHVEPTSFNLDTPPWEDRLAKVTVNTTVYLMTIKEEQSEAVK